MFKTLDKRYVLTVMQLIGPFVAAWGIYTYATLPWLVLSLLVFFLIKVVGTTVMYHRILGHGTHQLPPILESIFTFFGLHATYSSPIDYCASHTLHHKYADTEKDPHSVKHMGWKVLFPIFWNGHMGPNGGDLRTVVRLMRNKITLFFHNYYVPLILLPYLLVFVSVELFFFAYFVPSVVSIWAGSLGTLNHDENGPYDRGLIYSILTGGEHKHVWHHNNARDTSGEGWLNTVANLVAEKRTR